MARCNGIDKLIGPNLAKCIAQGWIKWDTDRRTIIGTASDGIDVELGILYDKRDSARLEAYLADHPTPDTW